MEILTTKENSGLVLVAKNIGMMETFCEVYENGERNGRKDGFFSNRTLIKKEKNITATKTTAKDIDSFNIEVFDNGVLIANGSYNVRTNFAHITMIDEDQDLEDEIVKGIENRTIELN